VSDAYRDARQRLLTQLELEESFWFTIVAGVDARPRERLRRVVRAWCDEHAVPFHDHALSPEQMGEVAPSLARDPAPGVHWIREDVGALQAATAGDFARLLLALNERRDAYVRGLKGALIVEGRASLRRQLQDLAPDLFSIAVPVPDLDWEPVEIGEGEAERWWHLWPDANDSPERWLERAREANAPGERFAALTHAAESSLSRGEFSRASPIMAESLGLARDLSQRGAMTSALVLLRDKCSVWAAALAVEEGDAEVAEVHLGETSAALADGALSAAREIERANVLWIRGRRGEALAGWEGAAQALRDEANARSGAIVEGAHQLLERGVQASDPARSVTVWAELMASPGVTEALLGSERVEATAWLCEERVIAMIARLDVPLLGSVLLAVERIRAAARAAGGDPYPWEVLCALGAARRLIAAGREIEAIAALQPAVDGLGASEDASPLALLANVAAAGLLAEHAVFAASSDAILRLVYEGLARSRALGRTAHLATRAGIAGLLLALAGAHFFERAGRPREAIELLQSQVLHRDNVPRRLRAVAMVMRGRLLHRTGATGAGVVELQAAIALMESLKRDRPHTPRLTQDLVYAWRDLGDCWSDLAMRDAPLDIGEALAPAHKAYATAAQIARRYQRLHPDDPGAMHDLAVALHALSTSALAGNDYAEAERLTAEDLAISRRLIALDPRNATLRLDLATTLLAVAALRSRRDDQEGHADALFEARTLAAAALRDDPDDARARRLLSAAGGDAPLTTAAAPPTPP
jgi:tetratricopeptide (TPR) repeat protein